MYRVYPVLIALILVISPAVARADRVKLEATGGGGGSPFSIVCPSAWLAGVDIRLGSNLDQLQMICARGRNEARFNGEAVGEGAGGDAHRLECPVGYLVSGIGVAEYNGMVGGISIDCEDPTNGDRFSMDPNWDHPDSAFYGFDGKGCPSGYFANGIHGRAGDLVDALGLLCFRPDEQPSAPTPMADGPGEWSAFASNGRGNWGFAVFRANEEMASDLAINGCGGSAQGCQTFWKTRDSCVAYAESRSGGYWYAAGGGGSAQTAIDNALAYCQSGTAPAGSCVVTQSACR